MTRTGYKEGTESHDEAVVAEVCQAVKWWHIQGPQLHSLTGMDRRCVVYDAVPTELVPILNSCDVARATRSRNWQIYGWVFAELSNWELARDTYFRDHFATWKWQAPKRLRMIKQG
jgi:hypothetical protein